MANSIEMGTVSSRGQICIPTRMRDEMGLKEGNKILFLLQDDNLLVKKVTARSFEDITKHLKEDAKKSGITEGDADRFVQNFRMKKR